MSKKGVVIIYALVVIFLFVNGVANFGYISGSKFIQMGILLLCLLLIALAVKKVIHYLAEEKVFVVLYCIEKKMITTEIITVTVFMLIALVARVLAAIKLKTTVEEVEFQHIDVLFPAQKIYRDIAGVFSGIAGTALTEYEIVNIIMSLLSVALMYFIVRTMYGRSGGFVSLFIGTLWPAHILGVVYDNNQYFCTMLFLAVIYFFLLLRRTKLWLVFSIVVGVALGMLVYMQTSMYILFVVFIASVFIRGEEGEHWTFGQNVIRRIPAIAISLVAACLAIVVVHGKIAGDLGVEKEKISGVNGYALLTGLNVENIGGENEEDYNFLLENYKETGNAKDAQFVCLADAGKRFSAKKGESLNLILKKAQYIFGSGYNVEMRKEVQRSGINYIEDAYYLLILLATGIFAIELLICRQHGNVNFIIVIGILIVLSGAVFMFEETVQMQFGYIMAMCSSAIVSIIYRRGLNIETVEKIKR